jgi:glutathione peroxidase-family protein
LTSYETHHLKRKNDNTIARKTKQNRKDKYCLIKTLYAQRTHDELFQKIHFEFTTYLHDRDEKHEVRIDLMKKKEKRLEITKHYKTRDIK